MCDDATIRDMNDYQRRAEALTRRQFGALSIGAGLAMLLPRAADALDVSDADIQVNTPDGIADCFFVHPTTGKHPGVLIWPDAFGLRDAFRQMATRLAESGYAVLAVNPYYRVKKAPVLPEGASFADDETRNALRTMMGSLNAETNVTDANAFVAFLDAQTGVDSERKLATTGYCMGGPMTMRTAAALPGRIGAAASFHGARLVTEGPDSPHLLVPRMKAHYLIAIAANDDEREPEAKNVLRRAFTDAGLPAEIEVYEGALHGWCPPGSAVYNEAQAEHAWNRLLVLFQASLA